MQSLKLEFTKKVSIRLKIGRQTGVNIFILYRLAQSLIILPSWKTGIELSGRHPVWIDPGQGFGNGHHLSTDLALEMLEQFLLETDSLPESMVDLGTDSVILAIAACRLGIKKVTGLDIEAEAVVEVERNCELNGLSGRIIGHVGQPYYLKKTSTSCNQ